MGKTVIIAEKPSVAAGIAKIVGANTPHREKANGYLEGNGYQVTWAFGHLVGLDSPEDMGFTGKELPMMPDTWKTHIIQTGKDASFDKGVRRQMEIIGGLFGKADRIIVATDAGREGELIFRYIYEHLGCTTPFDRLWISSLTDEAIRKGLSEVRDGHEYDALSAAAHSRSEADWLVGYNASRALRVATKYPRNLSLGRVQTPTLCMICERFDANKNFKPTPYWQVQSLVHKDMTNFTVTTLKRYEKKEPAEADCNKVSASRKLTVTKVEKKQAVSKPPLLFDLTALQRAANSKFGLTADETLKVAQALYESKYLTYPRTGSCYIPEDVFRTIPSLIAKVGASGGRYAAAATGMKGSKLCRKSVNDSKVTDHHALLPTENIPADLKGKEKQIWELVCSRMLEAFGEDSLSDVTKVEMECQGVVFGARGSVMTKAGWKAVNGASLEAEEKKKDDGENDEDKDQRLPPLTEGEVLGCGKTEVVQKTDKPLPIYTDASLLGDMETCGKKIEDEELRQAMKDVGLGTPATRAATIEGLIARGYIERQSKKLIPTDLGNQVWSFVRGRKIADVKTTGEWERDLSLVEQGKIRPEAFNDGIKTFVNDIINDLAENCRPLSGTTYACPCCGRQMERGKFSIFCKAEDGGCGFKIPLEAAGKKLTEEQIGILAKGGCTKMIKGFTGKSGTKFDAMIRVNREARKCEYAFDDHADEPQRVCPCCGKPMTNGRFSILCDTEKGGCGLTVRREIAGKTLPDSAIKSLCEGKTTALIKGFTSKNGKKFDASLAVDKAKKSVEFVFDEAKSQKLEGLVCPACGSELKDSGSALKCESADCGFVLWKIQGGVTLTPSQIKLLLSGKDVPVNGMKNKEGKKYNATLSIDRKERKVIKKFK